MPSSRVHAAGRVRQQVARSGLLDDPDECRAQAAGPRRSQGDRRPVSRESAGRNRSRSAWRRTSGAPVCSPEWKSRRKPGLQNPLGFSTAYTTTSLRRAIPHDRVSRQPARRVVAVAEQEGERAAGSCMAQRQRGIRGVVEHGGVLRRLRSCPMAVSSCRISAVQPARSVT